MSRHCIQIRSVGDKNSLLHHDHLRSRNHHRIRTSRERIFHRHKKTGRQNTLNDLSNDVGSNKLNDVGPCQQVWRPNKCPSVRVFDRAAQLSVLGVRYLAPFVNRPSICDIIKQDLLLHSCSSESSRQLLNPSHRFCIEMHSPEAQVNSSSEHAKDELIFGHTESGD